MPCCDFLCKKEMPKKPHGCWINPQEQHPEGEKIRRLSNAWHPPGRCRCLRLLRSHQAASEAKDKMWIEIGKTLITNITNSNIDKYHNQHPIHPMAKTSRIKLHKFLKFKKMTSIYQCCCHRNWCRPGLFRVDPDKKHQQPLLSLRDLLSTLQPDEAWLCVGDILQSWPCLSF